MSTLIIQQDRQQKWPNTLEATRKKKETFLKDREDQAEAERQEIDKQEAEFRRENRLALIKKANEMIYDQTDKMKMLRSERLYADVIHTRQSQIEDKKVVLVKEVEIDRKYHLQTLEQVRRGEEIEKEKDAKVKAAMEIIKVSRLEQLESNQKVREAVDKKNAEEGSRLKKEAIDRNIEAIQLEADRVRMIKEKNHNTLEASKQDKLLKLKILEAEERSILAREAEVYKIDERKQAIKDRQAAMFVDAQQVRKKMIERAVESLSKVTSKEATILNKQIAEQQAKADGASADKESKIKAEWDLTVLSRTELIRKKNEDKAKEKASDDALAAKWKRENEEAIAAEKTKQLRWKEEQTKCKLLQLDEGHRVAAQRETERQAEIEQTRFLVSLQGDDDKKFTEACKSEIERNVRSGKPVYTLLRALEFTQPALLAAKTIKQIKKKVDDD